jgi:hypothetical protein
MHESRKKQLLKGAAKHTVDPATQTHKNEYEFYLIGFIGIQILLRK